MQNKQLRIDIVEKTCEDRKIDPQVILELLALEDQHRDLFAWGSRPNLRRDIEKVVDKELGRRRGGAA